MNGGESAGHTRFEWAVSTLSLDGQKDSGDRCLVEPFQDGVLLAVVDGLGHGSDAAHVAERAIQILKENARESVGSLLKLCHAALLGTRGVVMTVASVGFTTRSLFWAGVGDVEGVFARSNLKSGQELSYVSLRGGVIGFRLPPFKTTSMAIEPGDLLILATDGVDRKFVKSVGQDSSVHEAANRIIEEFGKRTDDALVLVVRFLGEPA